ncbi:MAG TPA: hypothetical protein VMV40_05060 [Acidiferrobacter sp.]|nr:hypothetical protein [Acidiferrobacter sp.]
MDAYQPIACALYDQLERAIITGAKLKLRWHEDSILREERVTALTLETIGGEEFLRFEGGAGRRHRARLDLVRFAD